MKKKFRLLKNIDFQKVISGKHQHLTNSLILYYKPNKLQHARLGLSVSKKFGNAVVRNATRRKIRAILQNIDFLDLQYDMVLITRQGFIKLNFQKQEKAVKKIFERMINEKSKK